MATLFSIRMLSLFYQSSFIRKIFLTYFWVTFCFYSMSNSSLAIIFFLSSGPISTFLPDPKLLIWLWYPTVMHSIFFATHHIVISSWHSIYLWSNKEHNGELSENRKVQEVQPGPDQTLDHCLALALVIRLKYQMWYQLQILKLWT